MLSALDLVLAIAGVFGFIATLVAAIVVVRSSAVRENAKAQKELIETLITDKDVKGKEILDLQAQQRENATSLASLRGVVDVLQTIPLKEIASGMTSMASDLSVVAKHQRDILQLVSESGKSK
jgi:acid phosphatase family membrane protein YuiD